MAFPTKAILLGGAGCLTAGIIGFSQARSSLSIKEQLALDGYILISEKEKVADEVWKERAKIYNAEPENKEILIEGLTSVNQNGDELKSKCNKFTDGKTTMKEIDEKIYGKITKLCTLNIKEYIKSHFGKGDEFIEKTGKDEEWNSKFKQHKERINKDAKDINEGNAKTKLPEYCETAYALQKSNSNSTSLSNANDWCVKRAAAENKLSED